MCQGYSQVARDGAMAKKAKHEAREEYTGNMTTDGK
jgi:hypothetical protein